MMIKTAGGPGLVSPIDFHERRTPRFSKATWVAVGIVVAAHAGLGVAMYYQRFEMPQIADPALPDPIDVTFERLPKPVLQPKTVPAPPNTRINETTAPLDNIEPIEVIQAETTAEESATVTLTSVTPEPVDNAPPIIEPVRQPPAVIRNPSWSRQPSADQMMRAYPDRAINSGVAGSASLNCLVLPTGAVTDCNVSRETPGGYGFGRAAQGLSRYFRVNPRTVNGAAEGSRVNINLRFNLPEE
ncbi:MAG: TonB family protein [Alphaproteobacteria bacterium]|uniref:TonB family protein n=1 Tax=Brevundimonas sp. TaxID=1871086 RepID=UPI0017F0ABEF|nr:TonB family protein [Brevundimonas sp.]MBU3971607.1 TonB family protein [Alphaproteobacteria bacterium]MBA3049581.1 TonB family protein [Brevundimonas sp.]MBU3975281.1 TonB family protein [Alphaproteobacteria bacterium]MBU4040498.1 TonB family protein [Alphaproteobacteria bacterium]MBU4134967.1 TonB family protein [Alphaproteobacteria bacterium]